ncbi:MAG: CHAT domain-containing protein [Coleofasciculus chthonoplastes F3-SA18-01]|uniref:CHAT domain-containing protein n=1 Tax=Coleofasciculus chthonoplastes TaxID=64178 RepID=UPI0032F8B4F5
MTVELNLRFPKINQVIVTFDDNETDTLDFVSPLSQEDLKDIQWYLEIYGSRYTTDVDDKTAKGIEAKLHKWGADLFNAVFVNRHAQRLFNAFQDEDESGRLLTITASHPAILSLPWELLRDPDGTYLVHDNPRISVRRRLAGAGGGRKPFKVQIKDKLRLLFIVSRPSDAAFIDPYGEAQAVLDAIEQEAAGRVEVEFLCPATLDNLVARLEDRHKPPIDIVHFDGHGVFDSDGRWRERAKLNNSVAPTKGGNGNDSNTGYLLFEDKDGKQALISAETLADMLNRQRVGLIVLSACQSAAMGGEDKDDAMGCVAARLTHGGISAVLAMTHSVLVRTTRQLFATFYQRLVSGEGIGEALDNARRDLYLNRERGERQRGDKRITLKLQDWFLPALYQAGKDTPFLSDLTPPAPLKSDGRGQGSIWGNIRPLQEAGFFGRSHELWQIERWFVQGTRRITVSGFGGQGKTFLVEEAGRWLHRTGMVERVCFVDYAAFQGVDAVGLAVSTLAMVLGKSLVDESAVNQALQETPTLVILDNLESLQPQPLRELLDVAKDRSEVGDCRVLLTTRMLDFHHPDYATEGSLRHRSLPLGGLAQEDALAYFQKLMEFPPAPQFDLPQREVLERLFKLVDFHPLSIGLLARQLKIRRPAELGERLEALVAQTPDNPLLASLNLSLERLDDEAQQLLPRLGVFQGGALESNLVIIAEFSQEQWQKLRPALEATGLIQPEIMPGFAVPYLKFHPTLSLTLWSQLSPVAQAKLLARHRQRYYKVSDYLYQKDIRNPQHIRTLTQKELPNLMYAVRGALDVGEEWAAEFVDCVNKFLYHFGLNRDREALSQVAIKMGEQVGSQTWLPKKINLGEELYRKGQYQQAEQVFSEIVVGLGDHPSYELCVALGRVGRCLTHQGKASKGVKLYHQGLEVANQLEESEGVKRQIGILQSELADAFYQIHRYDQAHIAYEVALTVAKEQKDARQIAIVEAQLGTVALLLGKIPEAEQRCHQAVKAFRQLNEPAMEAAAWHQLGRVYETLNQWDEAEQAYRESARIQEYRDNIAGAVNTWNQLAILNKYAGKTENAESWYRKALNTYRKLGSKKDIFIVLNNLADLLQNQSNRLQEAHQLAEEALAISKTLDPASAEVWKTYTILANIADKQNETTQAQEYRHLSREAIARVETQYLLEKYRQLIAEVVATVDKEEVNKELKPGLEEIARRGGGNLVFAINRIFNGERDENILCESLDLAGSMIIYAILRGIADPETLKPLL